VKPDNDCFRTRTASSRSTRWRRSSSALADAFSGLTGLTQDERFALAQWETEASGAPVLPGALATFDCQLVEAKDFATHRVLFGKVTGVRIGDSLDPLIYHQRAYRVLG
jgi:cob(II)yrinic acid a,c-diamide reductase